MLPALILVLAATLYRVCYALAGAPAGWGNFSPTAAVLLCSAAYLPRKAVLLAALGPLVVADLFLNAHYHAPLIDTGTLPRYFCFAVILLLGFAIRRQQHLKLFSLFALTLCGSCIFFLVTNTESWLELPGYAKTFQGWRQAMTTGLPGYPSTLFFFRNTLFSDLLFTGLFVVAQLFTPKAAASESAAGSGRPLHHQT